jgi:hypothetical protein
MRFSTRTLLIATTFIAAITGTATYGLRTIDRIVGDAYRVWGTGDLVVDFMNTNNQQWPQSWSELESHYDNSNGNFPGILDFSDVQDHMQIDFSFDPTTVDLSNDDLDPPFRAIWLRNGTNTAYVGTGPNEIVYRHLKSSPQSISSPGKLKDGEPDDPREPPN